MQKATITKKRKISYQKRVNAVREMLPNQILPNYTHYEDCWSRATWRSLAKVAKLIADWKNRQRRLEKHVKLRLRIGGKRTPDWREDGHLLHQNILQVMRLLRKEACLQQESHFQPQPQNFRKNDYTLNNTVRKSCRRDEPYAVNYMRAKRDRTAPSGQPSRAGSDGSDIKDNINVGREIARNGEYPEGLRNTNTYHAGLDGVEQAEGDGNIDEIDGEVMDQDR